MNHLLQDVFQESLNNYPFHIAVSEEGGREVSYQDLDIISNKFANFLSSFKKDVKFSSYIGILSPVHINSIAAVLGVLKAGGAYIPLDEYSPTERLKHILDNTKMDTIVVDPRWYESHQQLFQNSHLKYIIFINEENIPPSSTAAQISTWEQIVNFPSQRERQIPRVSDDLAYVLHTSGSTGIPKGIMLTHRNARTFVDWMHKEFKLTCDDVVMSRAPFKFDLSVFDIFNTFKAGAKLICFDWYKERSSEQKHKDYVKLIEDQKATILYSTPSTFITLMNRGGLGDNPLSLRQIMYAGEPFPTSYLRRLKKHLPSTRIANIYGPTETNIITYYWVDHIPADDQPIPLGFVVDDTEIIVVQEKEGGFELCEPNELGELWCRGGTVTSGYLGMPEKTKECLVQSQFHSFPTYYWRTGDYGFYDLENVLHYRGRKDHMVKVKGFRIEIGEIESALASIEELDECAVVAVPDEKYGNRLCCFYSLLPKKILSVESIKTRLMNKLPDYMIPYQFFEKTVLAKTSSGKVDRISLAELIESENNHAA